MSSTWYFYSCILCTNQIQILFVHSSSSMLPTHISQSVVNIILHLGQFFQLPQMKENMHQFSVCVWLISLNMSSSRSIILFQTIFHSSLRLTFHCAFITHIVFPSPVDGQLGRFYILASVISVVFLVMWISFPLSLYPVLEYMVLLL